MQVRIDTTLSAEKEAAFRDGVKYRAASRGRFHCMGFIGCADFLHTVLKLNSGVRILLGNT